MPGALVVLLSDPSVLLLSRPPAKPHGKQTKKPQRGNHDPDYPEFKPPGSLIISVSFPAPSDGFSKDVVPACHG